MCGLMSHLVFIEFNIICVLFVYGFIDIVQPEILQDSTYGTHKYITANGIKFHYVANGTEGKPLMLFIHGFPEVSRMLTAILKLTICNDTVIYVVIVIRCIPYNHVEFSMS